MSKKYDSYEIEIVVSLSLLIIFLISLSIISTYSFTQARKWQLLYYDERLNIAADNAQLILQKDVGRWQNSHKAVLQQLKELSVITGVADIAISDTLSNVIAAVSGNHHDSDAGELFQVRRAITHEDGRILAYVVLSGHNEAAAKFGKLAIWDAIFRIAGLISALIVGAFFLKSTLLPYRKMKRRALDYNLDWDGDSSDKGVEYVIDTFNDVVSELEDKRHQLESLYASSERRADSLARYNDYILGSISSGVVFCDSRGVLTRINQSAQNILMISEKVCHGKNYREVFKDNPNLIYMLDDALQKSLVHSRLEFEYRQIDGKRLWLGCSSSMINDENGEGMGAVLLMIDLSEIIRLREISNYHEKMASLGETAAGLAHEIRNSFAAIVGFSGLLKKGVEDSRLAELVDGIRNESMAAENLLSRFLNFARPLELKMEKTSIEELLDSAINSISHSAASKINMIKSVKPNLRPISVDPALLRQAITNMLLNACDAMPGGGDIKIEVLIESNAPKNSNDILILSIQDKGIGMTSETISRIFEPFYSDKPNGTGLGLAMTKKIIALHGGSIDVQSKPGKGSKFIVRIPLIPAQNDRSEKIPHALQTTDKMSQE